MNSAMLQWRNLALQAAYLSSSNMLLPIAGRSQAVCR
jgi:hypothetical protein